MSIYIVSMHYTAALTMHHAEDPEGMFMSAPAHSFVALVRLKCLHSQGMWTHQSQA